MFAVRKWGEKQGQTTSPSEAMHVTKSAPIKNNAEKEKTDGANTPSKIVMQHSWLFYFAFVCTFIDL